MRGPQSDQQVIEFLPLDMFRLLDYVKCCVREDGDFPKRLGSCSLERRGNPLNPRVSKPELHGLESCNSRKVKRRRSLGCSWTHI